MSTYITRINGIVSDQLARYKQCMVADIAHQLGCREMGIYCYNWKEEPEESLNSRIDGIIGGINAGDLVICQFPTGNGVRYEKTLVSHLKNYGSRVAIFVQEENLDMLRKVIDLYNQAEVLIVPSLAMQQFLLENGIRENMKFVFQEMWDIVSDVEAFGVRNDIEKRLPELMRTNFGVIWYQSEEEYKRLECSNPFLLSRYLMDGIPVIVPVGSGNQVLIEKNGLGLAGKTLDEALSVAEGMEAARYQEYIGNVKRFAPALREGYFTKRCLIEAMQAFYRKDAGRIPILDKVYDLREHEFTFANGNISYGGKYALSWSYHGDVDGFLIYDLTGKQICKIDKAYCHYMQIEEAANKGTEVVGNGYIIKAYVETRKGILIVAETEPIFLQESRYKSPKVSVIIPAFQAEKFIARSMDMALAQSFSDLEIIVVDDGSLDHTPEILDWYGNQYPNVVVIHQKNGLVSGARNTGIQYANGEYICFLDSDDMIHPDMIERFYSAICKNDCDIVIGSAHQITEKGCEILVRYPMEEDVPTPTEDFFWNFYLKECGYGTIVVCKLYKASLVKAHLFPTLGYEDEAWTPMILSYADKVCYLDGLFYQYDRVICADSIVHKRKKKSQEELRMDARAANRYFLKHGNPKRMECLKALARKHGQNWEELIREADSEETMEG